MPVSSVLLRGVVLCVLLCALLAGCSNRKAPDIVGAWDNTKGAETAEFRKDGTGTFTYADQKIPPLNFMWKSSGEHDYLLEVSYVGSNKVISASLQDGTLNLQSELGTETYRRKPGGR